MSLSPTQHLNNRRRRQSQLKKTRRLARTAKKARG
jgi:hypothetical protein